MEAIDDEGHEMRIGKKAVAAELLFESSGVGDYPAGFYRVQNADAPEFTKLLGAGYLRRVDDVPAGFKVRDVDALELETINRERPTPEASAQLSQAQVVDDVFRGDAAMFERAAGVGFPSARFRVMTAWGHRPVWKMTDIQKWSEHIRAVAGAIAAR
jgi:hypothetical protein